MSSTAIDLSILRDDLIALASTQMSRPLGDLTIGSLLGAVLAIVRRHGLVLPSELALLIKTIAMCEDLGAQIDPSFQLDAVIVPFLVRAGAGR